jgi:twitching motility protein PilT
MYSMIQTGTQFGMQTLDQCLLDLVRTGQVTVEEARNYAQQKDNFLG